jgi:hypothetical protein
MEKKMNIKRAFIGITALMLLPAVAFAQPGPIPVTPAEGTALIMVQKVFADGNDETEVTLSVQCTSGSVSPTSVTVQPGEGVEHAFVIDNIPSGPDNVCTVKKSGTSGYYTEAICADDGEPDEDCLPGAEDDDRLSYCLFNDVQPARLDEQREGDVARCQLFNYPTPVTIAVTKEWDVSGAGGNYYNRDSSIEVSCNGYILGADYTSGNGCNPKNRYDGNTNKYCYSEIDFDLDDSDGDYEDSKGKDVGMATVTLKVVPKWYPTAAKPADQEYTECEAHEYDTDSAVEVDETDCAKMEVAVGMGDSCTITNTLFFEGIPTLNQYGMAIMALLMLGVGFVGFRRFV